MPPPPESLECADSCALSAGDSAPSNARAVSGRFPGPLAAGRGPALATSRQSGDEFIPCATDPLRFTNGARREDLGEEFLPQFGRMHRVDGADAGEQHFRAVRRADHDFDAA